MDKKEQHLAVALLFDIILCLSGKPKLLEQIACETDFQKSVYLSMLLSGCYNGQ
jgi:hypothetical protein